ncbi:MAG TPA: hypothetical protein DDY78_10920 [Planctomycetales bacterium]|nr:hypothetical protein [Planctomycetales bacterium]
MTPRWFITLMVVGLFGLAHGVSLSEEPSPTAMILLEGTGNNEIAPHEKGNVYAPCVLLDAGRFKMWYGGQGKDGHDRISYAESEDGQKWIRKGVVLKDDLANHVNGPSVVKVEGRFFMYYTRTKKDVVDRIDVATSTDGLKWKVKGVALRPGEVGQWDSLSVGRPAVIFEDGLFKMWYDGRKDFPPGAPVKGVPKSDKSQRSVGYATSKDGLKWERYKASPVFDQDAGGVDVQRVGKSLVMLYESRDGTRLAVSEDGTAWTDRGLFVRKSGKEVDAFGHLTPNLLVDPVKHRYHLFFGAAAAKTWDRNKIAVVSVPEEKLKLLLLKD